MKLTRPGQVPMPQIIEFVETGKSYEQKFIQQYTEGFIPTFNWVVGPNGMREVSYGHLDSNKKNNSHLTSQMVSKITSGGSYKLPRSVRKQLNSESEERLWQE